MFKRLIGGIADVVQSAATTATTSDRPTPDVSPSRRVPDQQEIDLSGLSNEEKAKILSVMEKDDDMQYSSHSGANLLRTDAGRQSMDSINTPYTMQQSVSNISMSSTNIGERQTFAPSWGPPTSDVGDIDLTGLSEEEKLKVLAVMQKADSEFMPVNYLNTEIEPRKNYGDNVSHVQPPITGGGAVSPHDVPSSKRLDSSAIDQPLFAITTNKEVTTIKPSDPIMKQQYTDTKASVQIPSQKRNRDMLRGSEDIMENNMDLDLTGLTPEERKQILSVMVKAGQQPYLETTPPRKQLKQITMDDNQHLMKPLNESEEKNFLAASSTMPDVDLSGLTEAEQEKILFVMHEAENAISKTMQSEKIISKPTIDHFDHIPKLSSRAPEAISPFSPTALPELDLSGMSEEEKKQIMAVMQKADGVEMEPVRSKKPVMKEIFSEFPITNYPPSKEISPMISPSMPDIDLSGLSEAERQQILSVIQKAGQADLPMTPVKIQKPVAEFGSQLKQSKSSLPVTPTTPDLDLSGLSKEEKQKILSVVMKSEEVELSIQRKSEDTNARTVLPKQTLDPQPKRYPALTPTTPDLNLSGLSEEERDKILSVAMKSEEIFSVPTEKRQSDKLTFSETVNIPLKSNLSRSESSSPMVQSPGGSEMDLTGLTEEERAQILSVMARAEEPQPLSSPSFFSKTMDITTKLTASEISSTSFTAFSRIRKAVSTVTTGISQTLEQTVQTKAMNQSFTTMLHDDVIPPAPSIKFIVHENLHIQPETMQDFEEETQGPIITEIDDKVAEKFKEGMSKVKIVF